MSDEIRDLVKPKNEIQDLKNLKNTLTMGSKVIKGKDEVKNPLNKLTIIAEQEFYDDINSYVSHDKYIDVLKYLDLVLDSKKINGFILEGGFGIGKSITIKSHLKQSNNHFVYLNSFTTPLSFYMMLYNNRTSTILLDDLSGLWKDEKSTAILRALLNTESKRFIKYESTSDKLKVPTSFNFEGKIVVLCNDIRKHLDEGVLSRVIFRTINFSNDEKLDFTKKIIKFNYPKLEDDEISEIYDFFNKNIDDSVINFSFRDLLKITELYKKYPNDWYNLGLKLIERDENIKIILDLIKKYPSVKERVNSFIELTGKHKATYYRYLKKYQKVAKSH